MGRTRDHLTMAGGPGDQPLHFAFPASEASVRGALNTIIGALRNMEVDPDLPGVVEIVLAEALNNVVEHAFVEGTDGRFEVTVARLGDSLSFCITDDGRPMPEGGMPEGRPHDLDVATEALPEGGFGWLLIRELTQDLNYLRRGGRNILRFRISAHTSARPN